MIRSFLLVLLMASSLAYGADRPPNIVLILADDLGWNALGCYGNDEVETPNLDRLAAEGMRFTQAYADTQCSPTRAALLSGQYGARTGVFAVTHERPLTRAPMTPPVASRRLPPEKAVLARMLRGAGYRTGMSGKWHVADNYNAAPLRKRPGYFRSYGFDFVGSAENRHDRSVEGITSDLVGFIREGGDLPFFAYFAHHAPHTPMEAPRELVQKYVDRGFKRSATPLCHTEDRPTANYYAMLDWLDQGVGRVLSTLDEQGVADNTVVIFLSDNGGLNRMASMAPLREAKGAAYEGGIRVPMIVRWPARVAAGATCPTPVHAIDLVPTLAELAGGEVPAGHPLDGASIAPLLDGAESLERDALYWHFPTYTPMYGRTPASAVRVGDWKLIHYFGDYLDTSGATPQHDSLYGKLVVGERTELYHLSNDLSERRDLAAERPEKVAELMARLESWWRETGAALPTKNPSYRPSPDWWK